VITRANLANRIQTALKRSRIVALVGPRQCGKTTLARELLKPESPAYFDLEDPVSLARLEQPKTTLESLSGLVVIDEVQRRPDLFPVLRVLADRQPLPAKFLILGSASPELLRQSSESLAGRMEVIEISGFSLAEVGAAQQSAHWFRGGFPLSFLAEDDTDSHAWRQNFVRSFVERDLATFGLNMPAPAMMRFWTMLAHYHGQTWNASSMAASLGVSAPTCRTYLDALSGVFMVRQLQPWHENLGKRQVKARKIYFRDSGLFHTLSHIRSSDELLTHPKLGASWEGYAIEEAIRHHAPDEAYFWATHNHAELDLLLMKDGKRIGIECKRADAPMLTPSMRIAQEDLKLDHLCVYYPGSQRYALSENVTVEPLISLGDETSRPH
jgi:predicted AAA+ superfamily ATPase